MWFYENYGSDFKVRLNLLLFYYSYNILSCYSNKFHWFSMQFFDRNKLNKSCTNMSACPKLCYVSCSQNKIVHPPFNIKFILYRCLKQSITNCIIFNETLLKKLKNRFLLMINIFRIHMQLLTAVCRCCQ